MQLVNSMQNQVQSTK